MACDPREQVRLVRGAQRLYDRAEAYAALTEIRRDASLVALTRTRDAAEAARHALGFASVGNCVPARRALRHAGRLWRAAVMIARLQAQGRYRRGPRPA